MVDARTGEIIKKIVTNSGAHNTIIGPDGRFAYLAGLKSPLLRVAAARRWRTGWNRRVTSNASGAIGEGRRRDES